MSKFATYRDVLNTAAVVATNHNISREQFLATAAAAYDDLTAQGYTPKPADVRADRTTQRPTRYENRYCRACGLPELALLQGGRR